MTGQPYVKTALEVACWDVLGRSLGVPLYMLLGGMLTPEPEGVGSIPPTPGDELEEEMGALPLEGQVAQLIDHEQLRLRIEEELLRELPFGFGLRERRQPRPAGTVRPDAAQRGYGHGEC